MYGPPYQHQRQQQSFFALCPTEFGTYAALHLDSIGKIINHVLAVMLLCDIFLFLSSWSVSLLPNIGFNTVLISFLLSAQTVCVWLIINNNRISALSFLSPTDFMVGVALGITIGGTLLALVLSSAYRHVSQCDGNTSLVRPNSPSAKAGNSTTTTPTNNNESTKYGDPVYELICQQHAGAMSAVWFWSGLIFWFNFCTTLLLAVGRHELSQDTMSHQYEHIGQHTSASAQSAAFEEQFRQSQAGLPAGEMMSQQQQTTAGTSIGGVGSFVGDYSTIPEIRTGANGSGAGSNHGRTSGAHIQQV